MLDHTDQFTGGSEGRQKGLVVARLPDRVSSCRKDSIPADTHTIFHSTVNGSSSYRPCPCAKIFLS